MLAGLFLSLTNTLLALASLLLRLAGTLLVLTGILLRDAQLLSGNPRRFIIRPVSKGVINAGLERVPCRDLIIIPTLNLITERIVPLRHSGIDLSGIITFLLSVVTLGLAIVALVLGIVAFILGIVALLLSIITFGFGIITLGVSIVGGILNL